MEEYEAVLLANEARGQMALEKFVYVVDKLYAKLEVVYATFDVKNAVFEVVVNLGHTALESLVYVVDRLYAKFEVVYALFEVALRDVSVKVDPLITMLDDA